MNAVLVFLLRLVFILLSYLFIAWMVYTIFIDLRGRVVGKKEISIPPLTLKADIDQDEIDKRFTISEVFIGRDPACNFSINDETISLRHCKLSFHHRQWWLEDLTSTNGTYLNETLVNQPVVVTDGDRLRLGRKTYQIQVNPSADGEKNE